MMMTRAEFENAQAATEMMVLLLPPLKLMMTMKMTMTMEEQEHRRRKHGGERREAGVAEGVVRRRLRLR